MKYQWTLFDGRRDSVKDSAFVSGVWSELVASLSIFKTVADKDGKAWSPARFLRHEEVIATAHDKAELGARLIETDGAYRQGQVRRRKMNVVEVSALVVDIDDGGARALGGVLDKLTARGVGSHWHTTFSGPEKYRVIVPLSAPVPNARWYDFWHWATKALGGQINPADTQCKDSSRLYYLPAVNAQGNWEGASHTTEGRPLDVEAILSLGAWPTPDGTLREGVGIRRNFPAATVGELWAAEQALKKHGDAVEGQHGDARTYVAAAILRNDFALTEEESWPLLWRWNLKHCKPNWSEGSLKEKLHNGLEYASTAYGGIRQQWTPWRAEYERALQLLQERSTGGSPGPLPWRSLKEIESTDYGATPWLVRGMLGHNSLFCIAGDPKASKTWALIELAISVASRTPFLGEFQVERQGAVALFLNEDVEDSVKTRARSLWAGRRASSDYDRELIRVAARHELDLGDVRQVAALVADVRTMPQPPVLLGLDPLRNLHNAEESDSTEMAAVMRTLRTIRDLCNCSLVFVHHSNKKAAGDTRSGGNRLRGSSAIFGAIDGLLSLEETENEQGRISNVSITVTKHGRGAGTFRLSLDINDDDFGRANSATWTRRPLEENGSAASSKPPRRFASKDWTGAPNDR